MQPISFEQCLLLLCQHAVRLLCRGEQDRQNTTFTDIRSEPLLCLRTLLWSSTGSSKSHGMVNQQVLFPPLPIPPPRLPFFSWSRVLLRCPDQPRTRESFSAPSVEVSRFPAKCSSENREIWLKRMSISKVSVKISKLNWVCSTNLFTQPPGGRSRFSSLSSRPSSVVYSNLVKLKQTPETSKLFF